MSLSRTSPPISISSGSPAASDAPLLEPPEDPVPSAPLIRLSAYCDRVHQIIELAGSPCDEDDIIHFIRILLDEFVHIPTSEQSYLPGRQHLPVRELISWDNATYHTLFRRIHPYLGRLWDLNRECDLRLTLRDLQNRYTRRNGYPYFVIVTPERGPITDLNATYHDILDQISHQRFLDCRYYVVGDFDATWPDFCSVWSTLSDIPHPIVAYFIPDIVLPTPTLEVNIRIDWAPNGTLELVLYDRTRGGGRLATFNNYNPFANAVELENLPLSYRIAFLLFIVPLGEWLDYIQRPTELYVLPSITKPLQFIST